MDKEVKEKILTKASKMFFRCSTMQLLSLILHYSTTSETKYIHKALSYVSGSLVGYNVIVAEDDYNNKKLSKMLIDSGVDGGLALALRLFMEGERGCALWALEEFLDEHNVGSEDTFDEP